MAGFIIPDGTVREMEERDIQLLARMCEDKAILDSYFVGEAETYNSMTEYWAEVWSNQKWYRTNNGAVRKSYKFPVEENGVIKGIFSISIDPYTITRKEIVREFKDFEIRYHLMHSAELSYFVGQEYRGQDICSRVVSAAVPFVFEDLEDVGRISAICLEDNIASRRVLEKAKLPKKWDGVSEGRAKNKRVVIYGMDYEEYQKRNQRIRLPTEAASFSSS